MSNCTNPEYEEMLHGFELGLLTDEDRQRFEEHLLDCESCFEQAKEFLPAAILMRHDPDLRTQSEGEDRAIINGRMKWFKLTRLVAVAAVLVAVVLPAYWFGFRDTDTPESLVQRLNLLPLRGGSPPVLYLDQGGNVEIAFAVDLAGSSKACRVAVLSRSQDTVYFDENFTDVDSSNTGMIVLPMTDFEAGFYQLIIEEPQGDPDTPKRVYNFRVR